MTATKLNKLSPIQAGSGQTDRPPASGDSARPSAARIVVLKSPLGLVSINLLHVARLFLGVGKLELEGTWQGS